MVGENFGIKGINSFDAEKGSRLSTYVSRCIDNEILMSLRANKKYQNEVLLQDPIGKDKDGNILLGDEISPDGCRLWDSETLEMLDKELFRKGKDSEVMDAYVEVYNRIIPDEEKFDF